MTMITPSYLGETIEYSSLHACRSTLEDPTHFTPPPTPSGNLDLSDGISWFNLVNVPSDEDAGLTYVVPGHPEQSLLFQKINCDSPVVGSRMPYGFPTGTLSAEQQALIWDWIAAGAPVGITDGIFRNGFDLRGFDQ